MMPTYLLYIVSAYLFYELYDIYLPVHICILDDVRLYLYYVWTPVHVSVYLNEVMFCYLYNAVQIHNGMLQNCTRVSKRYVTQRCYKKNNMLQSGNSVTESYVDQNGTLPNGTVAIRYMLQNPPTQSTHGLV